MAKKTQDGYIVADYEVRTQVADVSTPEILYSNSMGAQWDDVLSEWSLQVSGVDNAEAPQVPTSWDVELQTSLDGVVYGTILSHKNGVQSNGSVISLPGLPAPYWRIRINQLTKGASATKVYISMVGRCG